MPAQKPPVPEDTEEEPQRRPPCSSPPHPPQLNGNNHHHGAAEAPSENDVVREPKEEEDEEAGVEEVNERDVEVKAEAEDGDEEEEDEVAKKHREDDEEGDEENGDGEEDDGEEDEEDDEEDSDDTSSSSDEDKETSEFVYVDLADIRKEVQCPICLGIIKKTRTVMECLHRFCRECIDKSMRMGNNECPACRTHCASRRSLRDDPNYDALIAALYPDIAKYEEEELAFHEEERTRNKKIQASIAQIFQMQSEALARRRTMGKEVPGQFSTRQQRRRRRSRGEFQGSEENEDENDDKGVKDSSSADERSTEGRRRRKRRTGVRTSHPSASADPDAGSVENDPEAGRENRGVSPGLAWSAEMLAWGRGGARSHTRHGNSGAGNNKNSRGTRLTKLVEYLRSVEEKHDELDIHLKLISLDQKGSQSLQQPYLCCRPSLSIKHLCEYVAHQTLWQAEEVEILLIKGRQNPDDVLLSCSSMLTDELQILKDQETLSGLATNCTTNRGRLILAYRRKETS